MTMRAAKAKHPAARMECRGNAKKTGLQRAMRVARGEGATKFHTGIAAGCIVLRKCDHVDVQKALQGQDKQIHGFKARVTQIVQLRNATKTIVVRLNLARDLYPVDKWRNILRHLEPRFQEWLSIATADKG